MNTILASRYVTATTTDNADAGRKQIKEVRITLEQIQSVLGIEPLMACSYTKVLVFGSEMRDEFQKMEWVGYGWLAVYGY